MKNFKNQFIATIVALLLAFTLFCYVYSIVLYATRVFTTMILFTTIGGIATIVVIVSLLIVLFTKKE